MQLHAKGDATGEDKTELCKIQWFKVVKIYVALQFTCILLVNAYQGGNRRQNIGGAFFSNDDVIKYMTSLLHL